MKIENWYAGFVFFSYKVVTNHTRRDDVEELGQERCHKDDVKHTTSPAEQMMSRPCGSGMVVMIELRKVQSSGACKLCYYNYVVIGVSDGDCDCKMTLMAHATCKTFKPLVAGAAQARVGRKLRQETQCAVVDTHVIQWTPDEDHNQTNTKARQIETLWLIAGTTLCELKLS
jgi:hypothetical protein